MTKEQAIEIINKAKQDRAKRQAYNARRWAAKKANLLEAVKLVSAK